MLSAIIKILGRWSLPLLLFTGYALWSITPWGVRLEQQIGLEFLFKWRGARPAPSNLVVLAITRESGEALGISDKLYEWSRSIHADAVERLHALGARLVLFDIFFEEAHDKKGDAAFARAMQTAGNVVLFARTERQWIELGEGARADQQSLMPPLPLFANAALATAPLILPKVPARVDRFFVHIPADTNRYTIPAYAFHLLYPDRALPVVTSPLYNFYGPPRTITTVEYNTLLRHPQQVADKMRNAVVFVGYSARYQPDQRDGFYTAFTSSNGLDISGVELAATAFANLKDGSWLREPQPIWIFLMILGMATLNFALARKLPPVLSALLISTIAVGASIVMEYLLAHMYLWLPWCNGILIQTPLAAGLGIWLRNRELQQQKSRLQLAFGKYLPEEEIQRLLRQRDFPATQELHHSVCLVTDAQGYSRLSEQLAPVQLSRIMQEYYSAVIGSIRAGHGLISDVAGDGVIALWPHLDKTVAWKTLLPVVEDIFTAVDQYNHHNPQQSLPTRIGIHAGEMVLGHFGAADHYEFRAMGDIVNTASRIEGVNKQLGTWILISEACLTKVDEELRNLGKFKFVGKDQPLRLYTPVSVETDELLVEFGRVLSIFETGQWQTAEVEFRSLAQQFPADGPCQFYAQYLADALQQSATLPFLKQGIVSLLQK